MKFFAEVFVTLLVIMDPLGNVPVYLAPTAGRTGEQRRCLAWQAVVVAGGVIAVFALCGQQIRGELGISVPALQGSGGLLLLLVALELLLDRERPPSQVDEVSVALVPLGTPLIAGPGAIHLLTRIFGLLLSAIAVQLVAESVRGFVRFHAVAP